MKEIGGKGLVTMTSAERKAFFVEAVGEVAGTHATATFEKALISKQKNALKAWAKDIFSEKEKKSPTHADVIKKIDDLSKEGVLSPSMEGQYLDTLIATQLGVELKPEEVAKINELSKKLEDLKKVSDEKPDNQFGLPNADYLKARAEMNDYLAGITPTPIIDLLTGVIGRGNLLASIKSPVTNIIGNLTGGSAETITRRVESTIMQLIDKRGAETRFSGVNNDLIKPYVKEAVKIFNETGYDVVRMVALKDERKTLGEKVLTSQGKSANKASKAVRAWAGFYEDVIFKKLMGTPDVYAASFHLADSLNMNSTLLADKMGLTGEAHKAKARELFLDATSITPKTVEGAALREQAIADALYATYQNKGALSDMMIKFRNLVDEATGNLKLGTNLEPFVKTPANVVMAGIEYSGFFLPATLVRFPSAIEEARNGKPENLRKVSREAVRAGVGLIISALLAGLLDDGDYIGDYTNASARDKEMVKLGNATYNSIRIGGKWISLDYFGVLAPAIAGFAEAKSNKTAVEKVGGFFGVAIAQSRRLPILSKLLDTYDWINQGKEYNKTAEEVIGELTGGTVDFFYSRTIPMIVSDIAKATDSVQRYNDYKNPFDDVLQNIPAVRESLPPKYNSFGDVIPTENAILQVLFGARVKTAQIDAVYKEVASLSREGINVTLESSAFQEMKAAKKVMTATEYNELYGAVQKNIRNTYAQIIESDRYQNADNQEKESILEQTRKRVLMATLGEKGYASRIAEELRAEKKAKKEGK